MTEAAIMQIIDRIETMIGDKDRLMVMIAGPPGAGKSTIAEQLVERLNVDSIGEAVLVPMDGYHYDNRILRKLGLLNRKGAPETFNTSGLLSDLRRIRTRNEDVAIPLFDRAADVAYANAGLVAGDHDIIVVEGTYLLLDRPAWRDIGMLFDLTVMVAVDEIELERRLIDRWLQHGHDRQLAEMRAHENDLVNAKTVLEESHSADLVIRNG